jgi:hypothetical protein
MSNVIFSVYLWFSVFVMMCTICGFRSHLAQGILWPWRFPYVCGPRECGRIKPPKARRKTGRRWSAAPLTCILRAEASSTYSPSHGLATGADCDPEERIRFSPLTAPFRLRRRHIAI